MYISSVNLLVLATNQAGYSSIAQNSPSARPHERQDPGQAPVDPPQRQHRRQQMHRGLHQGGWEVHHLGGQPPMTPGEANHGPPKHGGVLKWEPWVIAGWF